MFWVAAAATVTLVLPTIDEAQVGALGDLVPNDADAIATEQRSAELFRFPLISRTLVVQRDPDGMGAFEQARVARRAVGLNARAYPRLRSIGGAIPVTNALGRAPFSRERSTAAVTYLFFGQSVGQERRLALANRFVRTRIEPTFGGYAGVTGALSARSAQADVIRDKLPLVELGTLLLVTLVVGVHFRAVGAPLTNLGAVAIAYLISVRLIAWIGERVGISVPREVEPVIVVLLFGVVTDYSIFFLSRISGLMAEGRAAREATVTGTAELLPIIVTAGLSVVTASAALVVAKLGFFQAFGPGMAMAVLLALFVAITLVPALLAIFGRVVFWPRAPERTSVRTTRRQARTRAVALATRRPVATALACGLLLLVAASGILRLHLGNPLIRGLPADSPARVAYVQASRGFAPGILSPSVVVVERSGITADRRGVARFQRLLERRSGVAAVVGPAEQPTGQPFGAVLSPTGSAVRYFVVLDSDPLGARAIAELRSMRAAAPRLLRRAGLPAARASFAGDTALSAETIDEAVGDIGRVAPVALALVLLILCLFLRALVAPLYLIAASLLALLAALGLATYVFQDFAGHGELSYFVPFAAAVLLVSLGSDYNVFLVGRIWGEARSRPLRSAITHGGARAATPITIAGLVLAASFALLFLVPVRAFEELAFTMAVGLLIDAFLVRTLLVPALMTLFGQRSFWPSGQ